MSFDLLFVIFITTIIQSFFGVGILLFGTPILLLLKYDFSMILSILLPISIFINALQLWGNFDKVDFEFYKKLLIYSVPLTSLTLFFVSSRGIDINFFVGAFLIILALKSLFKFLNIFFNNFLKYEKIYLIVLGLLHGISNLGGALLSGAILNKSLTKLYKRSTIAICYLTLAVFQIIALVFAKQGAALTELDNIYYLISGFLVYNGANKFLFLKIREEQFNSFSNIFLFFVGIILIFLHNN